MTVDEFKSGNYVIEINSYSEFNETMKILEELGFTWRNGKKYSEETLERQANGWSSVWKNENGVTRFSDRRSSFYVIVGGNKLSKKVWNAISDSNPTRICGENLFCALGLDVDEEGFEREAL